MRVLNDIVLNTGDSFLSTASGTFGFNKNCLHLLYAFDLKQVYKANPNSRFKQLLALSASALTTPVLVM